MDLLSGVTCLITLGQFVGFDRSRTILLYCFPYIPKFPKRWLFRLEMTKHCDFGISANDFHIERNWNTPLHLTRPCPFLLLEIKCLYVMPRTRLSSSTSTNSSYNPMWLIANARESSWMTRWRWDEWRWTERRRENKSCWNRWNNLFESDLFSLYVSNSNHQIISSKLLHFPG